SLAETGEQRDRSPGSRVRQVSASRFGDHDHLGRSERLWVVAYGQAPLEEAANVCSDNMPYCCEELDCDVICPRRCIPGAESRILRFF
ncbi:hypothetical protein IL306_005954, partial [Fusarium sp. DS 682]